MKQIIQSPSSNFNDRPADSIIDMLILHYTDMETTEEAVNWLCDSRSQVSAHYVISEDGQVFQLVQEDKRAWHAGQSYWQGRTDINNYSIGIELANPGKQFGYRPFPDSQINSLITLCHDIFQRHPILSQYVLGHSDVAQQRKIDPDYLFPWQKLAENGIGIWPQPNELRLASSPSYPALLQKIGYDPADMEKSLIAFQRHYQPHKMNGIPDQETLALLHGLVQATASLDSMIKKA